MFDNKQLGLYWGSRSFCIIEAKGGKVTHAISVPFDASLGNEQSQDVPEGIRYTALIQKALREKKIINKKVNLSVPAKDMIFRSFVIPWMEPGEVKNVVDFEATKYIPIKLEDLAFTYHPVTIIEGNQKSLRILFVAVRKDILGRYTGILEHTGLIVQNIEPAPVSLVRVLQKQGLVAQKQCNAIIEVGSVGGKIIIVDRDVVQFVREFAITEDSSDVSAFTSKLLNDIRVSLNFYVRQNPDGKIKRIVTLSSTDLSELAKSLKEEFDASVKNTTISEILKAPEINDIGMLSAFGIAIRSKAVATKNFDLFIKSKDQIMLESSEITQYKNTAIVVAICVFLILLSIAGTHQMASGYRKRLNELDKKQGSFKSSETKQISSLKTDMQDKLTAYQDVRISSNVTHYLEKLPKMFPKGAWLDTFMIQYYEEDLKNEENKASKKSKRKISRISVTLAGNVYNESANEQIRLVNTFVSSLKEDADLQKAFDNIDLLSVNQAILENFKVAKFRIVCK